MLSLTEQKGLNAASDNQQIQKVAFDIAVEIGHMVFASSQLEDGLPTTRGIEVHYFGDDGHLYFGISKGKPFYYELLKKPYISGGEVTLREGKLGLGLRINSYVTEIDEADDPLLYERYWQVNQGTKELYARDLKNFKIFRFEKGDGEIFDLCQNNTFYRYRFNFGGGQNRPWFYRISDSCIGCGVCTKKCMMQTISLVDNKANIDYHCCLECGVCYFNCPQQAIKRVFDK